tara:strand:- start:2468 stop:2770 length:303 start_codon:yes stop_codon:yes gene_type:complete
MAFWAAALPFLQAAGLGAAGALGAKAISGKDKDEGGARPIIQGAPPPQRLVSGSDKDDAVKAVLIENIKSEREARQALHDAEKALTKETVADIAETAEAQ